MSPLCSPHRPCHRGQGRARARYWAVQAGGVRRQRPRTIAEDCAQLSQTLLLPRPTPAFTQPSGRAYARS